MSEALQNIDKVNEHVSFTLLYEKENPSGTINTSVSLAGYDAYYATLGMEYWPSGALVPGEIIEWASSFVHRSLVKQAESCYRFRVAVYNDGLGKLIHGTFLLSGYTNWYADDKLFQVITNINEISAANYKNYVRLYGVKFK